MTINPAKINCLKIYIGATFSALITWYANNIPVDLTGASAEMEIRPTLTSSVVLARLSTEDGSIVLGGEEGTINLVLTAEETSELTASDGVYDLKITRPGETVFLIQGKCTIQLMVTRDG